jgi:hypothetical protein
MSAFWERAVASATLGLMTAVCSFLFGIGPEGRDVLSTWLWAHAVAAVCATCTVAWETGVANAGEVSAYLDATVFDGWVSTSLVGGALAAMIVGLGFVGYAEWSRRAPSSAPAPKTGPRIEVQPQVKVVPQVPVVQTGVPPRKEEPAAVAPPRPQPDEAWLQGIRRLR